MNDAHPAHWQMSPSSSNQWMGGHCPGSIKHPDYAALTEEREKTKDHYEADRGTLGHAIVEATLGGAPLENGHLDFLNSMDEEKIEELKAEVAICVEFVRRRYGATVRTMPPEDIPKLYLELKIKDDLIDEHGGTMDVNILTPDVIDVTDFKFGRTYVEVNSNTQIGCYLNLARQKFPGRKRFFGSIVQPKHHEGLTYEWTAEELDDLAIKTIEASVSTEIKASDDWCTWCPLLTGGVVNGRSIQPCEMAARFVLEEIKDFPDLTDVVNEVEERKPTEDQVQTLAKIYRVGKMAEDLTKGANAIIKRYARLGVDLKPANLAIRTTPRLYWTGLAESVVLAFADKHGFAREDVTTSPGLITPAEFRDLISMDKDTFREEFGPFLDVRETEALFIGRECRHEFPEFSVIPSNPGG